MISLKSNIFFSKFEEGIVFRGGKAPVIFKGRHAYELFRVIHDQMESGLAEEALIAGLPAPARGAAGNLLADLRRHGLLRERDPDDSRPELSLDPGLRNLWNYLADHHGAPGRAWEAWRGTEIAVGGTSAGLACIVHALSEAGAGRVRLPESELGGRSAGEAAIRIHAAGDSPLPVSGTEPRDCWYFGLVAGHMAFGFAAGPLAAQVAAWSRTIRPAASAAGRLPQQRVALAAAAVAFAAFKAATGLDLEGEGGQLRLVEPSFQVRPLPVAAPVGLEPLDPPESNRQPAPEPPEGDPFRGLFDPVAGIFEEIVDDTPQVPLCISTLRVFDSGDGSMTEVRGWGANAESARQMAIERGLALYARARLEAEGLRISAVTIAPDRRQSLADAAALAPSQGPQDPGSRRLSVADIADPDCHRLAKLIALLSGEAPDIVVTETDSAATAAVKAVDETGATARAGDPVRALRRALGDTCSALQSAPQESSPAPSDGAPEAAGWRVRSVDLGRSETAGRLYCACVEILPGPA